LAGSEAAPGIADIQAAAARLAGHAVATPLLSSDLLDRELGCRLFLKAEPLQRTGSFKFRGAWNRLNLIADSDRPRGVIAYSSGNHAQGVALAARLKGVAATIVMPADAPAIKLANTRALGAEVRLYDRARESREEIGDKLMAETGATLIRPYDDAGVIAGQGTIGLELAAQLRVAGLAPDLVACPHGGGGLIAGLSLALEARPPAAEIWAVEPADFDRFGRSVRAGERRAIAPGGQTFCDALMAPMPGRLTFQVNRRTLAGAVAVSDAETAAAMRAAWRHFKLVVEPGGAVALAAALSAKLDLTGRTVVVVASGGNVDPALYAKVLAAEM